ncbi:hypothetical protein M2152_001985 [Microbacteriaceae bacterium SG_E_30_P1]|uniref:Uncharacterized protein n=1 Tax=Antiquaquibacter oligotrophicus TaxID=2880260 RepID=A0ABT6KP77_9MICO|nr:hypothetical protein [Antiquaquibacter oligotrophicus]MDH6181803.1 hypothetical protein [Antiquaquibacter oligotrophicus]UDF12518.1 hypothetical protein LH407_10180 [Antiquaquibacter oligotrophicus]
MAREVDSLQFLGFVGRIIRAGGIRVGNDGDEFELAELVAMHDTIDEAIAHAVDLHRSRGKSWTSIGDSLGISRQAAQQRFGSRRSA